MPVNKIIFNWIRIQNFFSVGPEIYFSFTKHSGMNYIFGHNYDLKSDVLNGSGKSTIFVDATLFALFGKPSRRVNKNSIVNRLNTENCKVTLNFTINEDTYIVESACLPTYCKLFKNGQDITKSSIKETYDFISTEIIKSSYTVFRNSIILSLNNNKNISEMGKGEKRDFIDELFNLYIFGKMFAKIKNDLNVLDKELLVERNNFKKLEKDLAEFANSDKNFEKEKKQNIKKIEDEIEETQKKINKLSNTHEIKTLSSKDRLEKIIEKINQRILSLQDKKTKYQNALVSISKDIDHNEKTILKHSEILKIVCNDCTTKINSIYKLIEIHTLIETQTTNKNALLKKISSTDNSLFILKPRKEKYEKKLRLILDSVKIIEKSKNEIEYLSKNIESLNKKLEEEKNKQTPFSDLIKKYEGHKIHCTNRINEYVDQRKYLDFLSYVLSDEGVKKYIISDLINILNNRIRKYLEEMGCEYTVIFDPNFESKFLTTTGECEYDNFSAGEKRRIDISTIFAFRDLLFGQGTLQTNILVCDEFLDSSIDEYCINSIIKVLKKEAETQTVFVVSHRECLDKESDFDNIIEIKKEGGYTSIISDPQGEI